jgi:hypothetical protein
VANVVDLDAAAATLARHLRDWGSIGCEADPITWRDAAAVWNAPLKTERSDALDPDSIGVRTRWPDSKEAHVVLFRGGWADVELVDWTANAVVLGNPEIDSLAAFETLLETIPARLQVVAGEPGHFEVNWHRGV